MFASAGTYLKVRSNLHGLSEAPLETRALFLIRLAQETRESKINVGYGGYVVGEKVVMISVPAPSQWRSDKGIELIGPRHFGFDFDFIPIEILQSEKNQ